MAARLHLRFVARLLALVTFGILPLAAGCHQSYYAQTILHADGSIERSIHQPLSATPEPIRQSQLWRDSKLTTEDVPAWYEQRFTAGSSTSRRPADRTQKSPDSKGAKTEAAAKEAVPAGKNDQSPTYFAATGYFRNVDELPAHWLRPAVDGHNEPALQRRYRSIDYGLVVEHYWEETLTEIVVLEDVRLAVVELTNLLLELHQGILEEILGEEYDFSSLIREVHTRRAPCLLELLDCYVDISARRLPPEDSRVKDRVQTILTHHGLALPLGAAAKEASVDHESSGTVLELTARALALEQATLRTLVRRKDGQPVADDVITLLCLFYKGGDGESASKAELVEKLSARLEEGNERVIRRRFGSEEEFNSRVQRLLRRVFGAYGGPFGGRGELHFLLTMPGLVVETTGTLSGAGAVVWDVPLEDAYPFGIQMAARSLVPQRTAQEKLFQGWPLVHRQDMLRYVELLADNEELAEVLRRCVSASSLQPLRDFRLRVRRQGPEAALQAMRELDVLLKLPAE